MLTLYYKPSCPYCDNVFGEAEALGVQFNLKNILSDESIAKELIELGGKRQVPFLLDVENNITMYESNDIIAYIQKRSADTAPKNFGGLKIHTSPEICDTCQ